MFHLTLAIASLLAAVPLSAICMILPETKHYAQSCLRLYVLTVFMQFGQVLVLRFASMFAADFTGSPIEALYGAAVLYLLIKVPGLMNASAHLESKAEHLAEGLAKRADRKSTRLNSSHQIISYAVFCLKKKK